MEDLNMLAADCVVISCCCQCLILQILIFVLLKLPCKLVRNAREYAKKKLLRRRKRGDKVMQREMGLCKDELGRKQSIRIDQAERAFMDARYGCGCCMEEVEKVMGELYQRGDFAFGSFWGREGPWPMGCPYNCHQ